MTTTIDVTGLTPEAVRTIETLLVGLLRQQAPPAQPQPRSVFDLFGKAPVLRTGADIARQMEEEQAS